MFIIFIMNYLKSFIFGDINTEHPVKKEWEHTNEPKNLEKYSLSYCPYGFQGSYMASINWWYEEQYLRDVASIEKKETGCYSTFPDFNEKVFDTEHYEQTINNLEKTYTTKAFENKQNIEITKKITPKIFNHKEKDYDMSHYEFIVTMTEKV